MRFERNKLYDMADAFFDLEGSGVMKLSPTAAIDVCLSAVTRGAVVARIEGGIWHEPGFEAKTDCIWDGVDPPVDFETADRNNINAAEFIREECLSCDCFILTAPSVNGWPHKGGADSPTSKWQ